MLPSERDDWISGGGCSQACTLSNGCLLLNIISAQGCLDGVNAVDDQKTPKISSFSENIGIYRVRGPFFAFRRGETLEKVRAPWPRAFSPSMFRRVQILRGPFVWSRPNARSRAPDGDTAVSPRRGRDFLRMCGFSEVSRVLLIPLPTTEGCPNLLCGASWMLYADHLLDFRCI